MLTPHRLRLLAEVAERGTISAAADALGYTPSAVSQQLTALERELGVPVLLRAPQGVRLTAAGEALVGRTESILAELDAAAHAARAAGGRGMAPLRLDACPVAAGTLAAVAICRFRKAHVGSQVSLATAAAQEAVARVRRHASDVALCWEDDVAAVRVTGLARRTLFADEPRLIVSRRRAQPGREPVRLADLVHERWIVPAAPGGHRAHVFRLCRQAAFEPRVAAESDDLLAVRRLVASGVGVALVPALAVDDLGDDVVVQSLSPPPAARTLVALYRETDGDNATVRVLLDVLAVAAADLGAVAEAQPAVAAETCSAG